MSNRTGAAAVSRWRQLLLCTLCMMLIANLQYSWTLFVAPMHLAKGWTLISIQGSFSLFIALETWWTPVAGWMVDRLGPIRGPRLVVCAGGVLVAVAWVIDAYADSLVALYSAAAISGVGAGGIYATCVGNAVNWFPDRRGLAVGTVAGGFGAGAALTVVPIKLMIEHAGYPATFFWAGLGQGLALCCVALILRGPQPGESNALVKASKQRPTVSYTPKQVLRTPLFWLLYVMFVMVSASGLMATAQLALIASDLHIAQTPLLYGASTLTVALIVDNVANGIARPFFGWISDRIGRENTMVIAFGIGGVSYLLLGVLDANPWLFVVTAALIFFTWGEIFSLFPATCTDSFGSRYATVNASLLYTAKGTSALLVPLANVLRNADGNWQAVFVTTAMVNFAVAILAVAVLRPMRSRQRHMAVALEP